MDYCYNELLREVSKGNQVSLINGKYNQHLHNIKLGQSQIYNAC